MTQPDDNTQLMRYRLPRIAVTGAYMRVANTVADVVNVSPTGALVRLDFKPRLGGEWPLVLDLPAAGQVWLNGRVVRCQPDPSGRGTLPRSNEYLLGLAFVEPSEGAQAVLDELCGAPAPTPIDADRVARRRPRTPVASLRRLSVSRNRRCPECRSLDVIKEARHRYACEQCGCEFSGFNLGLIRVSL